MAVRGANKQSSEMNDTFIFDLPRPIWIHLGRIVAGRGIEQFLQLNLPGSKVLIGDGPDRERLQRDYPDCRFLGYRFGEQLAAYIAGADVFVYPDKIDASRLISLDALAHGLPVAAMPGNDLADGFDCGTRCALDDNLGLACENALKIALNDAESGESATASRAAPDEATTGSSQSEVRTLETASCHP